MSRTRISERPSKARRKRVLQRDGFTCQDCGCLVGSMEDPQPTGHVHHVTPLSEGGTSRMDNLLTLCVDCHADRHGGSVAREVDDTSIFGQPLSENPNWDGGRTVTSHGYVMVKAPNHPDSHSNGYIYEHRIVAENKIGRRLESDEHVHHKNGDKQDNRPENLEVRHESEHLAYELRGEDSQQRLPGEENPEIECACGCGETLKKYDKQGRPRKRLNGHTDYATESPTKDAIVSLLRTDGPLHRTEIARRIDRKIGVVSSHLSALRKRGSVEPVGGGEWDAKEETGL